MSLRPDQLFGAFSLIMGEVCGEECALRSEDLTAEEWERIDERWRTLKIMNQPREHREPENLQAL